MTAMDRPLGNACGNALEMRESIDALNGNGPRDLMEVTYALGAEMLLLGGVSSSLPDGRARISKSLADGSAKRAFAKIIEAQRGDPRVVDDISLLPRAPRKLDVTANASGVVQAIDTESVGIASMLEFRGKSKSAAEVPAQAQPTT